MISSLQDIETIMENFKEEQSARIDRIESRTKEMNCLPSSTSSSNEKMIVAQYARGKSEAEIAKDLRIGIGEIDLVLKLANLK
jgi:cell fate regulator YaaT (PSP1 superfamily)